METTKNIKICEDIHRELKIYCAINGFKINDFVEELILKNIKKHEERN